MPEHYYSKEEVAKLKTMFAEYQTVEEIAKALNRSLQSVSQKLHRLNLKRNIHTVRMVSIYGKQILQYGDTPTAIKTTLRQVKAALKANTAEARQGRQQAAIRQLQQALKAGASRNHAIIEAYEQGATLAQIGHEVKLTKQAVGLIVTPPKPKKYDPWNR